MTTGSSSSGTDREHFVSTGNQTDPFFGHGGVPVQFGKRWCLNIAKTTKVLSAAIAVKIDAIGRRAQFGSVDGWGQLRPLPIFGMVVGLPHQPAETSASALAGDPHLQCETLTS